MTIEDLKNSRSGRTAAVIATGPSVNDLFGPHLKDACTIGVNGAYRYFAPLNFWASSNRNFAEPQAGEIKSLHDQDGTIIVAGINLKRVLGRGPVYVRCNNRRFNKNDEPHFNLTRELVWGPTAVLDVAIPLAFWLGVGRILLIGCDYPLDGYRRIDGKKRLHQKTQDQFLKEMKRAHYRWDQWARVAEGLGVEIVNCSKHSQLKMFKKIPLAEAA